MTLHRPKQASVVSIPRFIPIYSLLCSQLMMPCMSCLKNNLCNKSPQLFQKDGFRSQYEGTKPSPPSQFVTTGFKDTKMGAVTPSQNCMKFRINQEVRGPQGGQSMLEISQIKAIPEICMNIYNNPNYKQKENIIKNQLILFVLIRQIPSQHQGSHDFDVAKIKVLDLDGQVLAFSIPEKTIMLRRY